MKGMSNQRGFTLFEMAIVLIIISVLAAILTPIVTAYVERARYDAARWDLKNIGAAIIQYNCDTKVWPIYLTRADIPNGNVFNVLKGPGNDPIVAPAILDWPVKLAAVNGTTSLDAMLNMNVLGFSVIGARAWKGAYLELGPDPWGATYYVTAANLRPDSLYAAYILSAGPNQTIETLYTQLQASPVIVGGDDLVQRIR